MLKRMNIKNTPFLALAMLLIFASCGSKKDIVYFQDALNYETIVDDNVFVTKFKVDDLLSIHVSSKTPTADQSLDPSKPFNIYRGSQEGGVRPEQLDYLVDLEGMIDFPVLGRLKVVGLSPDDLRNMLKEELSEYLSDPIINIRLKNFEVTVNGEVNRPGTYRVNGERINMLEALGLAGDLKITGRRDNILVIRDFNGTKVYSKIDITSKTAMTSPAFYLTQNDIIYVEPNSSAITSSKLDNRANIAVSIASVLITSTVLLLTRSN